MRRPYRELVMKKMQKFKYHLITFIGLIFLLANCGDGSGTQLQGFQLDLPEAIQKLNLDALRVEGSAWSLNGAGAPLEEISIPRDATRTIRGNYGVPVTGLKRDVDYEYRLNIYYQADAYVVPSLSALVSAKKIEVNSSLLTCPNLSLTPDASLTQDINDQQWLLLCRIKKVVTFSETELTEITEAEIICDDLDADGDGLSNIDEIDLSVNPYEGDYDGDCVSDSLDAFPKDPSESVDTDGDGIGDNSDIDADGDGLSNTAEAEIGTNPLNPDTDGDGIVDGSDNCPLDGSSTSQADVDLDDLGDLCDNDSDNDGLTDETEAEIGTDPLDADSDDDTLSDSVEVNLGINPLNPDTDGDGSPDGVDVFPADPTESVDTDGDGVGDNADLCPADAEPENIDTDSDGIGNACDEDDDGDTLSDLLEAEIGSDPLNPDTDSDGLLDWYGGAQTTGQDPCLLIVQTVANETNHNLDADSDGFGSLCDCNDSDGAVHPAQNDLPDTAGLDNDCDGVDGDKDDAIFVNPVTGDNSNDGSFGNPVADLTQGGILASSQSKDVYVAEAEYVLTELFDFPTGVTFFGGYSSAFNSRNILANPTVISSTSLIALVQADETGAGSGFDGVTLRNTATGSETVTLLVVDGEFSLINSRVEMGAATHLFGVVVEDGDIVIDETVIDLSNLGVSSNPSTARGVYLTGSDAELTDLEILISETDVQRQAIYCVSSGPSLITVVDTDIDVLEGAETPTAGFDYVVGCTGGPSNTLSTIDGAISDGIFNGFDITNVLVDGLF